MYFRCGWKMCRSWERMWLWRMNCTSMAVESCPTSQSVTQSQNLRSSCKTHHWTPLPPHNNNPWTNRSVYVCNHFNFSLLFFSRHKTISLRVINSLQEDNMYLVFNIYMSIWDLFVKQFTSDSLVHVQSHSLVPVFFIPLRVEYQRTKYNQSHYYMLCII